MKDGGDHRVDGLERHHPCRRLKHDEGESDLKPDSPGDHTPRDLSAIGRHGPCCPEDDEESNGRADAVENDGVGDVLQGDG